MNTRRRRVGARTRRKSRQRGGKLDVQKMLDKTGIEFHWPGYQYMGPSTKWKKRLARGDPGINPLGRIVKQHDIHYSRAHHLKDNHKADCAMIARINKTERVVKKIMQAKVNLGV